MTISTVGNLTDANGNPLTYLVDPQDPYTFVNEGRILKNIFGDSFANYNIVSASSESGQRVITNTRNIQYTRGSFIGSDVVLPVLDLCN